jgi:carboxyl-terminal processing protease
MLALSAALVFWAGLSLGGQMIGRDAGERAAIEAFAQAYQRITDLYIGEWDPAEVREAAIGAMFDTLDDPYSIYMGADEYAARFEDISGEFGGVGAVMQTVDAAGDVCEVVGDGCRLEVVEVLPETPAETAGLLAGDRITGVDGEPISGLTISDTVTLIRGPAGSDVVLALERDAEPQELTITRDRIVTQDVRSATVADGRVGYVLIDNFTANAADDFEAALREQLDAGVEALIVDVRGDPGGFVDAAVSVTSQFIGDGPVFWEENADGERVSIDARPGGLATDLDLPLAVLVDRGSASASELMAGALQDAGRAILVGEPTFGKGSVQEWTRLPSGSGGFRLSVANWLTRDQRVIEDVGLQPDVLVVPSGTYFRGAEGADPQADVQMATAIAQLLDQPLPEPPPSTTLPVEVEVEGSPGPDEDGASSE